ncbi:MAG: hypothetical protein VZR24_16600 [Butyrivibrio hungatei]|nr:hypothetical protein [Butyrivibrio hungatei]
MSVEETLKHIGTYWDIYRYLGREERSFDDIKKYLMKECDKPESTARANISGFKTARDTIIKISPDGKSVSVDPQKWNNLFWTMDKRMHFSEYDDRANELKEVFDAYYEGVEENADLSQELRELEEELSKEKRKRQVDVEEWKARNEALQDKIKDCELKNCYKQIYYMDCLLNPPKVEVQEVFTPNRYEYECDVYEYIRRNHNAPDAQDVVLKDHYKKFATIREEEIAEMKKHYEDYKSKKYGPLGKVIMFIVCMYRRFIGKRYEWAIRHFLINDIRREFAREMLDRKWFVASKNGKYYTRYQLVPQKQLQELYTEVERIRKAYESTYGPLDHKLENEPTGKEAS